LALALHRGLLVVGAALHLLEQTLFLHALLEGLERRFDLVFYDLYPHEDLRAAAVFTCAAARSGRGGTERSTILRRPRRARPVATAVAMVGKRSRDSSMTSPAAFTLLHCHPERPGVERA